MGGPGSGNKKKAKNPPKKPIPTDDESTADESDNEIIKITKSDLKKMIEDNRKQTTEEIKEMIKTELKTMQNEIVKLQSELEKANQRADNAEAVAEKFKKDLNKLQEKIQLLTPNSLLQKKNSFSVLTQLKITKIDN